MNLTVLSRDDVIRIDEAAWKMLNEIGDPATE